VWAFLRTSYLRASNYQNNDYLNRPITAAEQAEGIETKNFERWLYQRDAPGYETRPAIKIQQAIKMWMVQEDKYYDYIARSGKKMGFDIDDRWIVVKDSVAVKVTYFDDNAGEMNLVFNNGDKLNKKTQVLKGDGKLKTATFFLPGLKANSLPYNYDFTLEAGVFTDNIVVSMVRVIQTAGKQGSVGINQDHFKSNSDINIIHNSANQLISVNSLNEIRQIEMFNSSGKKEKSLFCNRNSCDLNTSGFTPGIYILRVQDKNGNVKLGKVFVN